jgi:hypothetical protein
MESSTLLKKSGTLNTDEKIQGLRKIVQGLLVSVKSLESQIGLIFFLPTLLHKSCDTASPHQLEAEPARCPTQCTVLSVVIVFSRSSPSHLDLSIYSTFHLILFLFSFNILLFDSQDFTGTVKYLHWFLLIIVLYQVPCHLCLTAFDSSSYFNPRSSAGKRQSYLQRVLG